MDGPCTAVPRIALVLSHEGEVGKKSNKDEETNVVDRCDLCGYHRINFTVEVFLKLLEVIVLGALPFVAANISVLWLLAHFILAGSYIEIIL